MARPSSSDGLGWQMQFWIGGHHCSQREWNARDGDAREEKKEEEGGGGGENKGRKWKCFNRRNKSSVLYRFEFFCSI